MTTVGQTVIMTFEELEVWGERLVIKTIEKMTCINPHEKLGKDQIKKELDIGQTTYENKVLKGKYPLKMYGTPKKRFALRSEFETWKRNDWGKY
jgi:hypothetical protein